MKNQITDSQKSKNEDALRKAYRALNDEISCIAYITVKDKTGSNEYFNNVNIVLCIARKNSYIEIRCKEKDLERYNSLGLGNTISVSDVIMKYEVFSDYQTSVKYLDINPVNSDKSISIRLN